MENKDNLCIKCANIILDKGMLVIGDNGVPLCYELKKCPQYNSLDRFIKTPKKPKNTKYCPICYKTLVNKKDFFNKFYCNNYIENDNRRLQHSCEACYNLFYNCLEKRKKLLHTIKIKKCQNCDINICNNSIIFCKFIEKKKIQKTLF